MLGVSEEAIAAINEKRQRGELEAMAQRIKDEHGHI